ncbi:MAG: sensor histidine kinase [Candidatus Binatia bacterium]
MPTLRMDGFGELAAGLAHELNQPLSAITLLTEACRRYLRKDPVDTAKPLELVAEIAAQSERATRMIAHLRSFIDKGEPEFEPVDIGKVVRYVPHLLGRELEEARVALRVHVPEHRLDVEADRIQIEEVLVNLVQNAIDSIQETNGTERVIELRARAVKGMCEVSVRDTGSGMSGSVAKRMFEVFRSTKARGLGIGLTISRSIVDAHRGRIWTEAPPDGTPGAVVLFSIPLK